MLSIISDQNRDCFGMALYTLHRPEPCWFRAVQGIASQ